ncbi:hypothetical protein MAR_006613 [Mya arenaria]|uniref:Reverse transcriptase domain-containing protein n=1 Tax=Mya arenaria TaxID=6604 RepID=A0ABY7DBK5_MYAAR|nr:hypothetical protein MAR_006613 [Mya arenaria]
MESLHAAMYTAFNTWLFHGVNRLKDAYYTVNVSEEFRKYLRFIWRGQLYQYTCLANGLAGAPRKFNKLLKPVFSCLRMKGFPSAVYLDDSYLQGTTYAECLENNIKLAIQTLQNSANYTIGQVAELIGKMISYSKAIHVPYWILYTKVLEQDKTSALKYNKGNFNSHMTLSAESLIDLDWWLRAVKNSGAPLYRDKPVISLTTDASSKGWGAVCEDNSGQWTIAEASFKDNINYLELNAVLLGLKAYTLCLRENHVRVRVDNSTAVAYINHMGGGGGGTRSKQCNDIARGIWEYAYQHNIWLTAEHVPGKDNYLADREKTKFVNMSCVREQYKDQGLSDNAIDVIMSSWRKSTKKQYTTYIHKWNMYCTENNVQVSSPVVCDVINFLDKLFSEGLTYNVLNTARSAISSFICLQNSEFSVGNHPIISRFMRGAFNMRPALPRYVNTWDVFVVIRYLKQQSPTEKLSFKPLTMKLVMLMALLSGQRAQSLQMLDIKNMGHSGDIVTFVINQLIKQTRPGFHVKPITFRRYTYDVDSCVVKTLDVYLEQSSGKRGEVSDLLLVSKNHIKEFQLKLSPDG